MKENEYMNIMSGIRQEFIEEAVSWDGSERKRIRQIRRMTTGFGAVAAAIALVVGGIAFKERKKDLLAADSQESGTESVAEEAKLNLFGGHGDIHVVPSMRCDAFYRDDDFWYDGVVKWSARSGGKTTPCPSVSALKGFYTDGEQLYRVHDGKIFTTDGFGNETELVDMNNWGNGGLQDIAADVQRIRRAGDALLLECYNDSSETYYSKSDSDCPFHYDVININLKDGSASTLIDPTDFTILGADENGYYASRNISCGFYRFDFNGNIQGNEPIWALSNGYSICDSGYADGKLYAVLKVVETDENGEPVIDENGTFRLIAREYHTYDLRTEKETTEQLRTDEEAFIGRYFYRALFENGKFVIYRSTLDRENEQQIYSVNVNDLWDMPEETQMSVAFMNLAETDDTLLAVLPSYSVEGYEVPTLHGEAMAMIDLNTGKVLYCGDHYHMPADSDAEKNEQTGTAAAAVSGTVKVTGTGTDTGSRLTTLSGMTTTTAVSTVQTNTRRDGDPNMFLGKGQLYPMGGNTYWGDDTHIYDLQTGDTWIRPESGSGMLKFDCFICQDPGCKHNSDACFAYRWNIGGINAEDEPRNYNISLYSDDYDMFGIKGGKCWRIDPVTGAETLCIDLTRSGYHDDDVRIERIIPLHENPGPAGTANDMYIVDFLTGSYGGSGGNRNLAHYNCNTGELQVFCAGENDESFYNGIDWRKIERDEKTPDRFYVMQNHSDLLIEDSSGSDIQQITLPAPAEGDLVDGANWAVYNGQVYYQTVSNRFFRYSIATGESQLLWNASPVDMANGNWSELGGVMVVPDLAHGSQSININRPTFSLESMQYIVDEKSPLYLLDGVSRRNNIYSVIFFAGRDIGVYTFPTPGWAN